MVKLINISQLASLLNLVNHKTKKTYIINKRKSLSFTCSKSFLKTVNKDG